ncbi:hypothetical protein [Myxosarcina sp. GI1(2024)]
MPSKNAFATLNRLFTAGLLVISLIACQGMTESEHPGSKTQNEIDVNISR